MPLPTFAFALGRAIRARRTTLKLSQRNLAEHAQTSVSYVSEVECGKHWISLRAFVLWCGVLGVNPCDLIPKEGTFRG